MTRFLGSEPARALSRGWCWSLLVIGVAEVVLFAGLGILSTDPTDGQAFSEPTMIVLGLMLAAQGAAGLLRDSREGISLWLSVLYALLWVPLVLLVGAYLYAWAGSFGVGAWAAFVVLIEVWDRARRRRAQS